MAEEIEVKYRVVELSTVRRALGRAGGEFLGTAILNDEYFDTPDRALLAGDRGVRLRWARVVKKGAGQVGPARPVLTYKGPARRGGKAKVRRELETAVEDGGAIREILAALGLEPTVRIEKRRSSYRVGRCVVELDELPLLGCFVEIEGPSERALTQLAEKLCLTGEPVREHYVALLRGRCRRVGDDCATVTRRRCPACGRRSR